MESLLKELQYIKGVGPKRNLDLQKFDVHNIFDLLWFLPRAYFNRANLSTIRDLPLDAAVNLQVRVLSTTHNRTTRGFHIFKARLEDDTGVITAVWFNQPFLANVIKIGQEILVTGKVDSRYHDLQLHVSAYEILDDEAIEFNIVPVYPLSGSLNQKSLRKMMHFVLQNYLPEYPEILNPKIRSKYGLTDIHMAMQNIHFPESAETYLHARNRLAFEELLLFQLSLDKYHAQGQPVENCAVHREKTDLYRQLRQNLPFALTDDQDKVLREIFADMESARVMNRLLQGDVGAGKTVVAALAMAKAVASGYQATLMAPTEILAQQHYEAIQKFFAGSEVVLACLTGGTPLAERRLILQATQSGEINLLLGTHALIQEQVEFENLGLVIIDEQHRFGVRQRALLSQKGENPDVLVMTATPIPRTLALTAYGDLDLSVIHELPPGRKAVKTRYLPRSSRHQAYDFARPLIKQGEQAYVVCPLVEESEKQDLQAAITLYEELSNSIYAEFSVGLIYGRMKANEKEMIMQRFKSGQIQVLVSTTVIEVGVDVPNASVIIIEHAERFGLSQLHQLRGRVGRGSLQSYCILLAAARTEEAKRRLKAMEKSNDGFELANEDLAIRGPGDFWGVRQHGLQDLKIASLIKDIDLIRLSIEIASHLEPEYIQNPIMNLYIKNKFKQSDEIARN
ncbi:MAG TPA: ATP-dependent DNA helicase RecG [Syntrophomonas sp.]|nr:ATP-dependent DNA helicase RecG [Syntrophomonas sp.]